MRAEVKPNAKCQQPENRCVFSGLIMSARRANNVGCYSRGTSFLKV